MSFQVYLIPEMWINCLILHVIAPLLITEKFHFQFDYKSKFLGALVRGEISTFEPTMVEPLFPIISQKVYVLNKKMFT